MRYLNAATLRRILSMPKAIEAMRHAFGGDSEVPPRLTLSGSKVMAGRVGDVFGVKVVSVVPGNPAGLVVVFDANGSPVGLVDGPTLTAIRTGAASGLATMLCAKRDAEVLAVLGAGAMARDQIAAVRAVRNIRQVLVWSRSFERAASFAKTVGATAVRHPNEAVREADIITTVTPATCPLFDASALRGQTHVNAVGAYRPDMMEVPADYVRNAWVVVDSRASAAAEAGDLIQAARVPDAEMPELVAGRNCPPVDQPTLFKTTGIASMDVAAAMMALRLAAAADAGVTVGE